ncbi:MAG TPA: GFA family protein [Opitutus sp.]|nr:GFA family protein [Opitutus sp.]
MSATITGGCLCGGTRYVLEEPPTHLADCHCVDCRRSSGAAYVTWGVVRRERVKLTSGELRKVPHAERVRDFAACCGTQLFFEDTPEWPTVDVAIATLDDPAPFAPGMAIWTEDKLPWVRLDETKPAYRRTPREG